MWYGNYNITLTILSNHKKKRNPNEQHLLPEDQMIATSEIGLLPVSGSHLPLTGRLN